MVNYRIHINIRTLALDVMAVDVMNVGITAIQ
jgi:hypothetical protein